MDGNTPQWLVTALASALHRIGATAPEEDLEREARALTRQWNNPRRKAQNSKYLSNLLERLSDFSEVTAEPATLSLAAAYLVTSPVSFWEALGGRGGVRGAGDMTVSQHLENLGVPEQQAQRVQTLVEQATSGQIPTTDLGAQILFDALLAMLATSPQRYVKYRESLREESGSEDSASFLLTRKKFVQRILSRSRIFTTPFASQWADRLRENLTGELLDIDNRLGHLSSAGTEQATAPASRRDQEPRLFRSGSDGPEDQAGTRHLEKPPPMRRSVAQKQVLSSERGQSPGREQTGLHPDDTSTMEDFDDLFSHKRRKRPSTEN